MTKSASDAIQKSRDLISDYERMNKELRFVTTWPGLLLMWPFASINREYLRFNLERIEAHKERIKYYERY